MNYQPQTIEFPPELLEKFAENRARFGGIRMMAEGGEGEGQEAPADEGSNEDEAPADEDQEQEGDDDDADLSKLPPKVKTYIEKLRKENGEKRVKAKSAENEADAKIKAALEALGVKSDEDPVKAAQAAAAEQEKNAQAQKDSRRASAAELIVWRNATELGLDADALTDSRSFEKAIGELDPDDSDFSGKVKAAAKKIAADHPRYAAQEAGKKRSGADLSGRGGPKQQNRTSDLGQALANHYSK